MHTKIITACFLILSTLSFAQNIPSYVPIDGLVGYWPFNGNANDESGNGNNGTVNGATLTADRNGIANSAYYFSSENCNTRIDVNVNTSSITTGLTMSVWLMNVGSGCLGPRILEFWPGNDGPGQAQWGTDYNGGNWGMGSITSTGFASFSGVPFSSNNTWAHLVYTNDGNFAKYYKDGVLIETKASNGNPILASSGSFGRMNHPGYDAYNGNLDDIAIYNRALSQEEITALFTGNAITTIPPYVPKDGLVGYWPFNGNANDESGNGNNGTVNGATLTADRNGIANSAYSFDGINNDISISKLNNMQYKPISYSVWFNPDSLNVVTYSKGGGIVLVGRDHCGYYDQGSLMIWDYASAGDNNNIAYYRGQDVSKTNYTPLINKWQNIIASIDENDTIKFYLNGTLISKQYYVIAQNGANIPFKFGAGTCESTTPNRFVFNGQIDDIAIYNRALSQQEITALYSGTPAFASTKVFVDAPASVNENENVEVSISTEALNSADNVIAFQTDLSYDTTRYTFVSNNLTGTLNPAGNALVNSTKNGKLNISYMTQTALNGAGSLVKLTFKANKTLGKGIFSLSNFLYNTTAVTSLKSDTVNTLDVTPPSARILYSQNPVRKGDSLLITVKYSEKMAVTPIPQFNLSGQNTLANSNLTKVNDTTYTYWWVVEKGNGAVQVTLATGKDLAGNSVIATPTQNTSFTVLPTLFGDIDTNKLVQAYDAALALQYSVGLNPLPTMDALPWSNWRIVVANVDTVGNVTANDASLILQHSAKLITTFPADAKKRADAPIANITVTQEANQLVFRATGTLYAFNVFMKDNFNAFGQPEVKDKNAMVATNISATTYNVGLASTTPFAENEPFLVIPIITNENVQGTMDIVANTKEKALAYGAAASIAINQNDAMVVYPNPTKDVITIHNAQGKTVKIVDVQGKEVYNAILPTAKTEISLKGLGKAGVYVLNVMDEHNIRLQTKKIVLE